MRGLLFFVCIASASAQSAQFVCESDSDAVHIASTGWNVYEVPERVMFLVDTQKGFKALGDISIASGLPDYVGSCRVLGTKNFECDGYDVWGWRIMAREYDGIGFRFSVTAQSFNAVSAWAGNCSEL